MECGTAYFTIDTHAVVPDAVGPDGIVAADAQLKTSSAGAADANGQLNTAALATLPPAQRASALGAIVSSTHTMFLIATCIMVVPSVMPLFLKENPAPMVDVPQQVAADRPVSLAAKPNG